MPSGGRRRTVAKTDSRGWTPFRRPLRYRSQAMGKNAVTDCKKIHGLWPRPLTSQTAFGGQLPYKGSLVRPAVRFDHSLFKYNGRLLRATYRVSGCTQDSRGLFGPSGADQRKAQDGCQNGQQRLDALVRTSPAMAPNGAFFHEPRVNRGDVVDLSLLPRISLGIYTGFTRDALWASPTEANGGLRTAGPSGPKIR